jgi:hypothetical protein
MSKRSVALFFVKGDPSRTNNRAYSGLARGAMANGVSCGAAALSVGAIWLRGLQVGVLVA